VNVSQLSDEALETQIKTLRGSKKGAFIGPVPDELLAKVGEQELEDVQRVLDAYLRALKDTRRQGASELLVVFSNTAGFMDKVYVHPNLRCPDRSYTIIEDK